MKILAFVDLHGSMNMLKKIVALAKKENVEYVVCAGDVTIFSDSMRQLVEKLDEIGIPVIMTHGNHEDEDVLRKVCDRTKNVKFMHKELLETDGYVFMVYGGGGFSLKDPGFEKWSKEAMKKISEDKKIILVTHAPPYGTKIDLVLDQSAGSKSIRQFIKLVQPKIAISGHLHENAGLRDRIDKTKVINPGPWGLILTV
ncbi:metallophosphoesterase [Candidatus Woesearchaeota archaeon]|jgi:Icc-related predicted phosphoesterase|nr:metallophosphoesterase [Candidatus Woesearchaeota archaeon]